MPSNKAPPTTARCRHISPDEEQPDFRQLTADPRFYVWVNDRIFCCGKPWPKVEDEGSEDDEVARKRAARKRTTREEGEVDWGEVKRELDMKDDLVRASSPRRSRTDAIADIQ